VLEPLGIERPALLISQIGQIRPLRLITLEPPRDFPHGPRFAGIRRPLSQAPMAEIIFEVEQKLLQTRPGDIEQAQFGLGGGRSGTARLGDILASGARRLNHLIDQTAARIEKVLAEPVGGIVDQRGGLKAGAATVSAGGAQAFSFHRSVGFVRSGGSVGCHFSSP